MSVTMYSLQPPKIWYLTPGVGKPIIEFVIGLRLRMLDRGMTGKIPITCMMTYTNGYNVGEPWDTMEFVNEPTLDLATRQALIQFKVFEPSCRAKVSTC